MPDRDGDGKGELIALVTTITDLRQAPAAALAGTYHERWEHETGNGQLKTHLRGPGRVLRSRSPDMARQEIYGYLLAHHAISALICQAATEADIDPEAGSASPGPSFLHHPPGHQPGGLSPLSRQNISATRSRPTSPGNRTSTRGRSTAPDPPKGHQASAPQLLPRQASQRQGSPPRRTADHKPSQPARDTQPAASIDSR